MNRSERIALIISESKLNQVELAKACGVSPGAITQWKNGDTKNIKLDPFMKFCEKTGTSPLWLALGKGEKSWLKAYDNDPGDDPILSSPQAAALKSAIDSLDSTSSLTPHQFELFRELMLSMGTRHGQASPFKALQKRIDGEPDV